MCLLEISRMMRVAGFDNFRAFAPPDSAERLVWPGDRPRLWLAENAATPWE